MYIYIILLTPQLSSIKCKYRIKLYLFVIMRYNATLVTSSNVNAFQFIIILGLSIHLSFK